MEPLWFDAWFLRGVEIALKTVVILLAGGSAALALRRASARVRHVVWSVTLTSTLLLVGGAELAGYAPRHTELLHLGVWFAGIGGSAFFYDPRLWPAAVAFGLMFLAAAMWPPLVYAALFAAVVCLALCSVAILRKPHTRLRLSPWITSSTSD